MIELDSSYEYTSRVSGEWWYIHEIWDGTTKTKC